MPFKSRNKLQIYETRKCFDKTFAPEIKSQISSFYSFAFKSADSIWPSILNGLLYSQCMRLQRRHVCILCTCVVNEPWWNPTVVLLELSRWIARVTRQSSRTITIMRAFVLRERLCEQWSAHRDRCSCGGMDSRIYRMTRTKWMLAVRHTAGWLRPERHPRASREHFACD